VDHTYDGQRVVAGRTQAYMSVDCNNIAAICSVFVVQLVPTVMQQLTIRNKISTDTARRAVRLR